MKKEVSIKYISKTIDEISEYKNQLNCLLITATDIETTSLHKQLFPLPDQTDLIKISHGSQTYYVGKFGSYGVVHVQCNMGGVESGSSTHTVRDAVESWEIKIVVMPGIAFGVDEEKQSIGDVLVSEAIAHHDKRRIGTDKVIHRSQDMRACPVLLNRFKNVTGWQFPINETANAQIIPGLILSGEALVDNKEFRDALKESHLTAEGGEMEGAGLASACGSKSISWILVKSICDFADGNKSKNKKQNQKIAAESSVSLCHSVFSDNNSLKELDIIPIITEAKSKVISLITDPKLINAILFDVYQIERELYYLKRSLDETIKAVLSSQSLWISGGSGYGKTCAIQRHLLTSAENKTFVSLGAYNGYSITEMINGLYCDLYTNFGGEQGSCITGLQPHQSISKLVELIGKHYEEDEAYISIEEIPISDAENFGEFIGYVNALIIDYKASYPNSQLKFILSSISNPKPHILPYQAKITESVYFHRISAWDEKEIIDLLQLIIKAIGCSLSQEEINHLIESANGSPRFIKKAIRNSLVFKDKSINDVVIMTKSELC